MDRKEVKIRRHKRVRGKIKGTKACPRLSVFRSSKHISAQLIDDEKARTLVAVSDVELKKPKAASKTKKDKEDQKPLSAKASQAYEVGKLIALKALKGKIKKVVFDKGPYQYHGRVKALAEGARAGGLKF